MQTDLGTIRITYTEADLKSLTMRKTHHLVHWHFQSEVSQTLHFSSRLRSKHWTQPLFFFSSVIDVKTEVFMAAARGYSRWFPCRKRSFWVTGDKDRNLCGRATLLKLQYETEVCGWVQECEERQSCLKQRRVFPRPQTKVSGPLIKSDVRYMWDAESGQQFT